MISNQMGRPGAYQFSPPPGIMGMQPQFGGAMMGGGMMGHAEPALQQQLPEETFDDAAFAKAFEDAARLELETQQEQGAAQEQSQILEQDQEVLIAESAERFMSSTLDDGHIPNQPPIGADLIHDPTDKTYERPAQEDPSALARTAGQLLNSMYFLVAGFCLKLSPVL